MLNIPLSSADLKVLYIDFYLQSQIFILEHMLSLAHTGCTNP